MTETGVDPAAMAAARAKLRANTGSQKVGATRIVGKGGAKGSNAGAASEERKLQTALKKLNFQNIGHMDQVIMRKENGTALFFDTPTVTVSPACRTTVINGSYRTGNAPAPVDWIRQFGELAPSQGRDSAAAVVGAGASIGSGEAPTLVEDFEAVADEK